jgi:hypothetical protein
LTIFKDSEFWEEKSQKRQIPQILSRQVGFPRICGRREKKDKRDEKKDTNKEKEKEK